MKPRFSSSDEEGAAEDSSRKRGKQGSGFGGLLGDVSARLLLRPAGGGSTGNGAATAAAAAGARGAAWSFPPALLAVFCVGLALGVIASERLYLAGALSAAAAADNSLALSSSFSSSTEATTTRAPPPVPPSSCACARDPNGGGRSNHSSWLTPLPPAERAELSGLEAYLLRVAPTREVLVALSNHGPLREGMLDTFLKGVIEISKIKNYVIVALDRETETALLAKGRNAFYMPVPVPESQRDTGANHAISALKFGVLKKFLALGWSVLLSDVDVAVLSDPFAGGWLHRDSDVEGMSDGFDAATAYGAIDGYEDVSMGWSRYAQLFKRFNLNSGLFFARSNDRTVELMRRLESRLSREKYWDQTAYNEELFFPSHGSEYTSPQATARVMDIYAFMNSKVLFKDVRRRPAEKRPAKGPCMVHVNYHPDKHARVRAVMRYYAEGDERALDAFPGGSEPGT